MHENWKDADGTVASLEEQQTRYGKQYSVVFIYKVDGEWYGGTFTTTEEYAKDDTISVLYDPANPERNNLVQRENLRHWVIGALVCAGGLFFLYAILAK